MPSSHEQMPGVELGLSLRSDNERVLLGRVVEDYMMEPELAQELGRDPMRNLGYCISFGSGIINYSRIGRENARVADETARQRIHLAVRAAAAGKIAVVRETEMHTIDRWYGEADYHERLRKSHLPAFIKKPRVRR